MKKIYLIALIILSFFSINVAVAKDAKFVLLVQNNMCMPGTGKYTYISLELVNAKPIIGKLSVPSNATVKCVNGQRQTQTAKFIGHNRNGSDISYTVKYNMRLYTRVDPTGSNLGHCSIVMKKIIDGEGYKCSFGDVEGYRCVAILDNANSENCSATIQQRGHKVTFSLKHD